MQIYRVAKKTWLPDPSKSTRTQVNYRTFSNFQMALMENKYGPVPKTQLANWVFTLFPQGENIPVIAHHPDIQYCVYQTEVCPETKRRHLQGFVQLKNRKRFNTVKLILGHDQIHLEPVAKNSSPQQAANYCKKVDTRVEGPQDEWGELISKGARTDLINLKRRIDEGATYIDLVADETVISTVARCPSFVKELIQIHDEKTGLADLKERYAEVELREWQDELTGYTQDKPDDRKVLWVCDEKGGQGKSFWANYMVVQEGGLVLTPAKFPDIAYLWKNAPPKTQTVIFDCTRTASDDANILSALQLAEALKNGCVHSTKYMPTMILRKPPHVLFLANFWPKTHLLSEDRWLLLELKDSKLKHLEINELPLHL